MTNEETPTCDQCNDELIGISYLNRASDKEYCAYCMMDDDGYIEWVNTESPYDAIYHSTDGGHYERIRRN